MGKLDFTRHKGLLDHELMSRAGITFVGAGGASGLARILARCGIKRFDIIEFDEVSNTNPATQDYNMTEVELPKAIMLKQRLQEINPEVQCKTYQKRYQDLTEIEHARVWSNNIVLAMTDDFHTQAQINKDAIKHKTDAFFAICYVGNDAVEITATFPDGLHKGKGCHHCHTKDRYDAYEHRGFENPDTIPSTALAAEYLNALLAQLIISRLHHKARSRLPVASLSHKFSEKPFIINRIFPKFWSGKDQPLADIADDQQLFTSRQWALDTPVGWTCPDCNTKGVVSPLEASTSLGGNQRGIKQRRRSWLVQSLKAAFGR